MKLFFHICFCMQERQSFGSERLGGFGFMQMPGRIIESSRNSHQMFLTGQNCGNQNEQIRVAEEMEIRNEAKVIFAEKLEENARAGHNVDHWQLFNESLLEARRRHQGGNCCMNLVGKQNCIMMEHPNN